MQYLVDSHVASAVSVNWESLIGNEIRVSVHLVELPRLFPLSICVFNSFEGFVEFCAFFR